MSRCYLLLFLALHVSCFKSSDKEVIASVYDRHLTLTEALNELPESSTDTVNFLKNYTDSWVRNQLLIYSAHINLSNDLKDFDILIEKYEESLLIYTYQQELINQKFDVSVDYQDVVDYYNQYSTNLD